jgi:hypothetical protein
MEDDLLDGESGYGEYASSGEVSSLFIRVFACKSPSPAFPNAVLLTLMGFQESGYFGNLRRGISGRLRKEDEEHGGTRRLVALRVLSRASTDSMISQLEMVQARLNAAGNFAEDWIFRLIYVTVPPPRIFLLFAPITRLLPLVKGTDAIVAAQVGCVCLRAIIWHARDFCPGKAGDPGNPFAGESGRVVTWLKVEAVAALGLPTFNMMVRMSGLTRDVTAWCVLYLLALFQTAWFLLGSVWSLSSAVPTACRFFTGPLAMPHARCLEHCARCDSCRTEEGSEVTRRPSKQCGGSAHCGCSRYSAPASSPRLSGATSSIRRVVCGSPQVRPRQQTRRNLAFVEPRDL